MGFIQNSKPLGAQCSSTIRSHSKNRVHSIKHNLHQSPGQRFIRSNTRRRQKNMQNRPQFYEYFYICARHTSTLLRAKENRARDANHRVVRSFRLSGSVELLSFRLGCRGTGGGGAPFLPRRHVSRWGHCAECFKISIVITH